MENQGRAGVAASWMEHRGEVLDIGCAGGMFDLLSKEGGIMGVGLDVSIASLREAKRASPGFDFVLASAMRLPWLDSSFDTILMLDVLEHVPDDSKALQEVGRVLRPGGRLILSVPHKGRFGWLDAQNSMIFNVGRKIMGRRGETMHHRHYDIEQLESLVPPGFKVSRVRYGGYLLFPLCGYLTMLTDTLRLSSLSESIRGVEQVDFDKDYGKQSWHLMAEFIKEG
jgi:SAM-dependent methyltransferase